MFTEISSLHLKDKGWIEVITGSMFSGKTEELIRRLKRATIANLNVVTFKPSVDSRYAEGRLVSHDETFLDSIAVEHSEDMLQFTKNAQVVGIDEAQFFDESLPEVCNRMANSGTRVIAAGLDLDYKGNPFGPVPVLLAIAEYITKVHAICTRCGDLAYLSRRTTANKNLVVIGEKDVYEPLCRKCFMNIQPPE